jgi:hypothetical protein
MIDVRRTGEGDPLEFEVVVPRRKGRDLSSRYDGPRDLRAPDGGQAHAGALSRGGLPVLARPRVERVDPRPLRRDRDLAYFPEFDAGVATLPLAALIWARGAPPKACTSGPP